MRLFVYGHEIGQNTNPYALFIKAVCIDCGKERWVRINREGVLQGNLHSQRCHHCARIHPSNPIIGKDENHPSWKGDNVGYSALHQWVKAHLPKPNTCGICHISPPYDLANKGEYNRDLSQWWWLCRRCHMQSDGRTQRS